MASLDPAFATLKRLRGGKRGVVVDMQAALRQHQIDLTIIVKGDRRVRLRLWAAKILIRAGARLLHARVFIENQSGDSGSPPL